MGMKLMRGNERSVTSLTRNLNQPLFIILFPPNQWNTLPRLNPLTFIKKLAVHFFLFETFHSSFQK